MEIKKVPAAIAVAVLVTAVVLFIVLSGGDDSSSTTSTTGATATQTSGGDNGGKASKPAPPKPDVIDIKDGEPVGGVQDLSFTEGDDIQFTVKSDAAYEIHFHGYDIPMDVDAGGEVTFDVPATITGVFEVEIEDTATQIAQITVDPG
jgi:hypothetical protein